LRHFNLLADRSAGCYFGPVDLSNLYRTYCQARAVCTDTRSLQPGDLFFALKGPHFNGNRFAAQALEAGAAGVVLDEDPEPASLAGDPRVFRCADALLALQELARHHRRQFAFPVFALTGSNGKTTTKELLSAVLSKRYRVSSTRGNLNNHIGVPLTLLAMTDETEMAVVEMGANAQGEIAMLSRIAEPDAGLITNIGDAHLEGFGGRAGVKKGKGELYTFLQERESTIFCWSDSRDLEDLARGAHRVLRYGQSDEANLRYEVQPGGLYAKVSLSFRAPFDPCQMDVQSQLVGSYNAPNLAAAACVGAFFGVEGQQIREALEAYRPANQRSEWRRHGPHWLYLDAYNANPSSMTEALKSLAELKAVPDAGPGSGGDAAPALQKGAVLGDMLELGQDSASAHQAAADLAGSLHLHPLVFIGPEFGRVRLPDHARHFDSAASAASWLRGQDLPACVLLLKGSRGIGVERVLEGLG
jgi:UDP-N-acetylmuramoyl-tripeptide--D-alanyl-D-alanine ligase